MKTIIIVFFSLLFLYLFITFIMFILISRKTKLISTPMAKGVEKSLISYKKVMDKGQKWIDEKYKKNQIKDIFIKSSDGLKLHAIFIEHTNSKGVILESHGYRSSASRDLFASCYEYYNMGYSLLIIDNRTCGKSEGKYITFGIKESKDIICWIKYINKNYPKQDIVLAGISMGATSILMSLKYIKKEMNIKCAIADSGYISAHEEVLYCINHFFHINGKFFINMIDIWCKLFAGFSLKEDDTIKSLEKSKIPILFIHGIEDDFVPTHNSKNNYQNYKGIKKLELFEKASHGISYLVDSKRYINVIKNFLK